MKKICLILSFLCMVNFSYSQEMKTIFHKNTDTTSKVVSYGGYGAPFVGATMLNGSSAVMVGGRGGFIRNHHFAFGGVGTAVIGSGKISGSDSIGKPTHTITPSMGYGGVFIEYIFSYNSPVHISIPVNIEVGGVLAGDQSSDFAIKSSSIFVVEPSLNFEFNFYKFFVPCIDIGYRYVAGSYSKDLSGVYGALLFKFGKF